MNPHAERARDAADQALGTGRDAAHTISRSPAYRALVKVGLVSYGIVHLLIGWLAVTLATSGSDNGETSNSGALRLLADAAMGRVLLGVVAAGFAMLVVWQLVLLLVGHREFEGLKRWRKRGSSLLRSVIFGYLAIASARLASGPSASQDGQQQQSFSRRLMELPLGEFLVGLVGLAIVGYGVYQAIKGIRGTFNEDLDRNLTGTGRRAAGAGFIAKGVAYGLVGVLFVTAAVTFDPEQAGGLDQALHGLLERPFGAALLAAVGVGLGLYGLYCFYWARHPKQA